MSQFHASRDLLARAERVIPGGVTSGRRRTDPPIGVRSLRGARMRTVDNETLIDYSAGCGAAILGHAAPAVRSATWTAGENGLLAGVGVTELEVQLTERLVDLVPSCDQVLLCNSGTEANLGALRLARAVTGAQKHVLFDACYHGHDDHLRPAGGSPHVLVCRYNDLDHLTSTLDAHPGEVAAIFCEPVAHNGPGIMPAPGFLEGIQAAANARGILFVCDEVITAVRHDLRGYQAVAGITPDLTVLGKALGGGAPIAALGGRRDLMAHFTTNDGGDVFWAGTYNGGAIACAAALAVLDELADGSVHQRLFRLGDRIRSGLEEVIAAAGISATVCGYGSLFSIVHAEGPITSQADVRRNDLGLFVAHRQALRELGVYWKPDTDGWRLHIGAAHTEDDIDRTVQAAHDALGVALRRTTR